MTTTANEGKRCAAFNRRGQPCQGYAIQGSGLCFWHDPGQAERRKEARIRGGHARHGRKIGNPGQDVPDIVIEKASDVLPILAGEIGMLLRLEISIARARAVGYLCQAVVKVFEVTDLQGRLEAVEAVLRLRKEQG